MQNHPVKPAGSQKATVPAWVLILLALFFAVVLLLSSIRGSAEQTHAWLSSLPLALAGVAYALVQIALRPARATLLKRLMLAATFAGWAVDQLLPAGPAALFLGDLVIAAYVLDLYWIIQEQTSGDQAPRSSAHEHFPPGAAIACNIQAISASERPHHADLLRRLRLAIREQDELPDGYVFRLDEKDISPSQVAEWVTLERLCCPFLTFQLSTSGGHADSLLKLTGPAGVKTLLEAEFSGLRGIARTVQFI